MTDFTTVAPNSAVGSNAPGLPPIDLVQVPPAPRRQPLRVTVTPNRDPDGVWGGLEEFKPSTSASAKEDADGIWGALPEHSPDAEKEAKASHFRDVGPAEAFGRSAAAGASFGLAPAIEGAMAAGTAGQTPKGVESEPGAIDAIHGLIRMGLEHFLSPEGKRAATEAYGKARGESQAALEAGREQHPVASFAGEMAAALAVPVPGLAAAAAPARIARGAAFGAAGGAAYGAGSGLSEGKDVAGIAKKAVVGSGLGAVTGGAFAGALGPRAIAPPASRGERAAEFADQTLNAPIPRGLASDNTGLNAATSAARSFPVIGSRIGNAVDRTQEAAGQHVEDIIGQMGAVADRAAADAVVRPGLQHVIDANRAAIDAHYNGVRGAIDQGRQFIMPRTQQALAGIRQNRTAAGWPNPGQGLEQFENVAAGATFNGAHRARVDAREAGNGLVPHPGYNAADYDRLTRAMTADIRNMAAAATRGTAGHPPSAAQRGATVRAFDQAETEFGRLAEQNGLLRRLIDSRGEGAIATLLNATKEKGGNLALLAQLHNSMNPADFHTIGGLLLHELGHNNATGEFSLAQFATKWDKVSPRARGILFSQQHLANIEQIAGLGQHIKRALRASNTSHTSNTLIFFDLARDAIMLGVGVGTGAVTGSSMITGGLSAVPAVLFTHWLASPAPASSMAAWTRARIGMINHPTPVRLGVFNLATRNLSNNLGVPVESILKRLATGSKTGKAEDEQPEAPRESLNGAPHR